MTTLFISYKRENKPAVQRLVEALRAAGLSVWWDQDIAPDDPWEQTIERQLEAAKVVIVAWSPAAVASENVKAEARRARGQGKLIQVFVEPCDPPLFFGERQGVDLSAWRGDADDHRFQTVLAAANAILAGKKPPQGVGYAPKPSNPLAWIIPAGAIVSGALALIANLGGARDAVCSIDGVRDWCVENGLAADAKPAAPPLDPAKLLADERARLLNALNGRWARGDIDPTTGKPRDCAQALTLAVVTDTANVTRLHVTAERFESRDQVETAADGVIRVAGRGGDGVLVESKYEPKGDQLIVTTGATPTTLHRCPSATE